MLLLCWHNNVNTFFFAIVFGIPPHANLMRTYSLPRPMVPHLQQLKPKTLNKKTIYYHYRYVKIYYHVASVCRKRQQETHSGVVWAQVSQKHVTTIVVVLSKNTPFLILCMYRKPYLPLLCCCCAGKTQSNNHTHRCRLVHGRAETHSGAVIEVQ